MRKIYTIFLFSFIFFAMTCFIFLNKNKIESDIFSLINLNHSNEILNTLNKIKNDLNKELIVLSDDYEVILKINDLAKMYDIFDNFKTNSNNNISINKLKDELNSIKIATLNKEAYKMIVSNNIDFFKKNADNFFNSFNFRLLSPNDDFFNLASYSSMFGLGFEFDISSGLSYVKYKENKFYIFRAILKDGYNDNILINFSNNVFELGKNSKTFLTSNALYAAYGKEQGNKESLYLGILSIVLVVFILIVSFGKINILLLITVPIFGFIFGSFFTFLIFDKVHIMSIIISTSLVGLMLDFSLCWLGYNKNKTINASSISSFRKIFLVGLLITSGGYLLFALAPLDILRQIAIFCSFGLVGAFLFTYFVLPILFDQKSFKQNILLDYMIGRIYNFCNFFSIYFNVKNISIALVFCSFLVYFLSENLDFKDNIKNYLQSPDFLLSQSKEVSKIMQSGTQNIVLLKSNDTITAQNNLINELLKAGCIGSYNSISSFFISQNDQKNIIDNMVNMAQKQEILSIYKQLGFDLSHVKDEFLKFKNMKIISLDEFLKFDIADNFKRFVPNKNYSVIYADVGSNNICNLILNHHNAVYINFVDLVNESFSNIKFLAVLIKLLSYILTFLILWYFFGFYRSLFICFCTILSVACTILLFMIFGIKINIFVVFGLILSSAIGIDYMVLAFNQKLNVNEKIFGILMSCVTSFISFFMLCFSQVHAIFTFGLSVSICILLNGIFACIICVDKFTVSQKCPT